MKRHFLWFKFLWSFGFILVSFLSLAATFAQPFNWFFAEMNSYRTDQKSFLLNRMDLPDFNSSGHSTTPQKRYSPIETAWQSYRAVSVSA